MLDVVVLLALLGLWVYAFLDAVTTDPARVRNAPKIAWIVVIVLLGAIGGALWLWLGRPKADGGGGPAARPRRPSSRVDRDHPSADRPTGGRGPTRPLAPDDDPEFLRGLERRLRGDDGPPR